MFELNGKVRKENDVSIEVIVCYFNGSDYIAQQLQSIRSQTIDNLSISVYDDCSDTPILDEIIENYDVKYHRRKTNIGYQKNFLQALVENKTQANFFAFSDQDDIWHKNKLETAINKLLEVPDSIPALFCSRTNVVSSDGVSSLGLSPLFKKQKSFQNALVQNVGGGNTMVLNAAAKKLISDDFVFGDYSSHDWWCYLLITAAGGTVIYDENPCLDYRQHGRNISGTNKTLYGKLKRAILLLNGSFKVEIDKNTDRLNEKRHLLKGDSLTAFEYFLEARRSGLIKRIYFFGKSGVFRQTFEGNIGLWLAILFNRI